MTHRLLLVPMFTELEWGIRPGLEEWAEVGTFDAPGVGEAELDFKVELDPSRGGELLSRWRDAAARRGIETAERRGWERFVVVADSWATATAVRIVERRREAVVGLAIGHAALSHATEGDRAPERGVILDAMVELARRGSEEFVRHGIVQMTRGGVDEETARQMTDRFPDTELVTATLEALSLEPEPIGDALARLDIPLLLAKHEGCLGSTDEGYEDIVAAFPDAATVICPEMCASSPAFAAALRAFCDQLAGATESARGPAS